MMGARLNYEIGQANIGRWVRLLGDKNGHARSARLVGAEPRGGVCEIGNHGRPEVVAWDHIQDWLSKNGAPLKMPPEAPADIRIRENGKAQPMHPVKHEVPMPALNMGDLGSKIREAVADVASAKAMLEEAEGRLRGLREQAVQQLNLIDQTMKAAGIA